MRLFLAIVFTALFSVTAAGEVYKVVDKETGSVTLTNIQPVQKESSSIEQLAEKTVNATPASESIASHSSSTVEEAFETHKSNVQVSGSGRVKKVLPQDNNGSRHQKFILQLSSGQTLLVAHNIDLAPEISSLNVGDTVEFNGEYEWNEKGGVIHWTHRDPDGSHVSGWLRHNGKTYQ